MRSSPGTEQPAAREPAGLSDHELRAELEQTRAQLAEAEDRYLRARADLDNYRKRAERELERRVTEQGDALLRGWLDVLDSVERALAVDDDDRAVAEGLVAVFQQMETLLARSGVRRIGEIGEQFDPELHDAVAVVPRPGSPPGTVAEIARPGYAAGERVIRPAQVAVARPPTDSDSDAA
jgi:molecular chaperone GrpE